MPTRLHCSHCNDVIGVYEPLVLIVDGAAVEASRLSRPEIGAGTLAYHRECYARLQDGAGAAAEPAPRGLER